MNKFTAIAIAAVLTIGAVPTAFAASHTGTDQAAGNVYSAAAEATSFDIIKVAPTGNAQIASGGVDQTLLSARDLRGLIAQNTNLSAQLAGAGISLDRIVGATADNDTNITLYVRS